MEQKLIGSELPLVERLRTMQGMGDYQFAALQDGVGPQAADEIERLRAQVEVAKAGYNEAIRKAEWQARTNREMNESWDIIHSLRGAIEEAIESGDEGDWQSARRVLLAAWKTPNLF